jgi:periplasmic divalent cation tolerance protein
VAAPKKSDQDALVVVTTVGSEEQARSIAEALVEQRLAACVNILPSVRSIYRWKGKLWDDEELLLVIKTTAGRFQALRAAIQRLHSYELPEILALAVADSDPAVLAWLTSAVGEAPGDPFSG